MALLLLMEFKDGKLISYLKTPPKLGFEVTLKSLLYVESLVISSHKIRLLYIKEACAEYGPSVSLGEEEGQLDILSLRLNS